MKFQEPDLRGLSLEELKIRNRLEAGSRAEAGGSRAQGPGREPKSAAQGTPVLSR
jgi:hypothetical protein